MTYRLKPYLVWSGLIVAVATFSIMATISVYRWELFGPKDYEECAESAAINAKSKDALSVLISICSSKFEGRRKVGDGYTYYDRCQNRTFNIKGPNRTSDELESMKRQCLAYLDAQARVAAEEEETERRTQQATQEAKARAQQAAQEAETRRQAAKLAVMAAIQVIPRGFSRSVLSDTYLDMKVDVTNGSKWAVSYVTVGFAFIPTKTDPCPTSFAQQEKLYLPLSPGETRSYEIRSIDAELSKHRVCIKVLDVAN
jgi:hypothetical protein